MWRALQEVIQTEASIFNCKGGTPAAIHRWVAHDDSVNGISLHPSLPILATASGQRKFFVDDEDGIEEADRVGEERMQDSTTDGQSMRTDNTLRIWWCSRGSLADNLSSTSAKEAMQTETVDGKAADPPPATSLETNAHPATA